MRRCLATLGAAVADPLRFNRLIGALRRYSLVEATGDAPELPPSRPGGRARRARTDADRRRCGRGRRGADAGRLSLRSQDDPATWAPSGALLAHALAAAGHAEESAKDLEGARWLLNEAARYLRTRAEFERAKDGYDAGS